MLPRWNNPETPSRTRTGRNETQTTLRPPETPVEWAKEYERRRAIAYGEPYTVDEVLAYGIFRAVDETGSTPSDESIPLREAEDIRFVQSVNSSALFRSGPMLEPGDVDGVDGDAQIEAGQAVWKRSNIKVQAGVWSDILASMGELPVEAVRYPEGVRLVGYDPEYVRATFDAETSSKLLKFTVVAPYMDPEDTNEHGEVIGPGILHTYKRVVDDTEIKVWIDGEYQESLSGPHNFGEIPCAFLVWDEMPGDPTHGVPCSHGMEARVARMDSISCQIDAAGKRYANPILAVKGAKLTDADVFRLGRIMSGIPADGEVSYKEPSMSGLQALGAEYDRKAAALRSTRPEYIFHGAGASASGEALKVRAAQFVGKVEEVRGRVFAALARLTSLAVAADGGPSMEGVRVTAPPVLPVDRASSMDALVKARTAGLLAEDVAAELQRVGYVDPDKSPVDYAREMMDREAQDGLTFFGAGGEPALPGEEG